MRRRSFDPRPLAAGIWTCAGALLASSAMDGQARLAQAAISTALGALVTAITWNRFPNWQGRPRSIAAVPVIAAIQLAAVLAFWWHVG